MVGWIIAILSNDSTQYNTSNKWLPTYSIYPVCVQIHLLTNFHVIPRVYGSRRFIGRGYGYLRSGTFNGKRNTVWSSHQRMRPSDLEHTWNALSLTHTHVTDINPDMIECGIPPRTINCRHGGCKLQTNWSGPVYRLSYLIATIHLFCQM